MPVSALRAMCRLPVMVDTGAGERVADAWSRIEDGLSRVLPASLRQLAAPAETSAIDGVETALAVVLPQDFRASLRIHNGTKRIWGQPSPVPLECLYDADQIVEATRMWRDDHAVHPVFDDPQVWAYLIDQADQELSGKRAAPSVWGGTVTLDAQSASRETLRGFLMAVTLASPDRW